MPVHYTACCLGETAVTGVKGAVTNQTENDFHLLSSPFVYAGDLARQSRVLLERIRAAQGAGWPGQGMAKTPSTSFLTSPL